MEEKANSRPDTRKTLFDRIRVSALEADLAYFDARLELVGHPSSLNEQAQVRAFRILNQALTRSLHRLKRARMAAGQGKGAGAGT